MVELFVGIDWGWSTHTVCIVDSSDKKVLECEVAHRGEDVLLFVERLQKLAGGDLSHVAASMESPHGVMVEVLLERGVATYSLNPKQLDRFRDRHSGAGAKDDDLDAYVLATSLRTDPKLFREITLPSEQRLQLAAYSRSYEALTEQVLATANQIRQLLVRYYPQMLELGDWHRERWLWELFEAAPTPALTASPTPTHPQGLSAQKVGAILKEHRIRRHDPKAVLSSLRATPLPVAAGVAQACATQIRILLPLLRTAESQRRECTKSMTALLQEFQKQGTQTEGNEPQSPEQTHHDAAILLSLPGIGVHNGAVMLTEASSALQQRDYQALRRLAGVAPVSRRTGGRSKAPHVLQRQACCRRLREATYHWGRVAAQTDPNTRQHYAQLRQRGHSHGRAIRGVVDRLLKVLVAMLRAARVYDPARRPGSQISELAA